MPVQRGDLDAQRGDLDAQRTSARQMVREGVTFDRVTGQTQACQALASDKRPLVTAWSI